MPILYEPAQQAGEGERRNRLSDRPAMPSHTQARIERKTAMVRSALSTAATRTTTSGTAAKTDASVTFDNLYSLHVRSLANLLSG